MGVRRVLKNVYEKLSNKPVAIPAGMKPDLDAERFHVMFRKMYKGLEQAGVIPQKVESFEESLDFEVDDNYDEVFPAGVSPSEMRYMQEEKMLTEAAEVSSMNMQRRAAVNFKERKDGYKGKFDGRGKGGVEGRDGGVSQERAARSEQAGAESGGESGVRRAVQGDSGSVR